jgi:hypothetical protein
MGVRNVCETAEIWGLMRGGGGKEKRSKERRLFLESPNRLIRDPSKQSDTSRPLAVLIRSCLQRAVFVKLGNSTPNGDS